MNDKKQQAHFQGQAGFSLVEVALALGIIGIGMVGMLGLLSITLNGVKDSNDDNQIAMIVNQVITDRQSTPFDLSSDLFNLPPLTQTSTNSLLFTRDGGTNGPSFYRIVEAQAYTAPAAAQIDIRVEWPAQSAITNVTFYSTVIARKHI